MRRSQTVESSTRTIVILGAILAFAIVAATAYETWRQRLDRLAVGESRLGSSSHALSLHTEHLLHSVEILLETHIASSRIDTEKEALDGPALSRIMTEQMSGIPQLLGSIIIDSDGKILASTNRFSVDYLGEAITPILKRHRSSTSFDLNISPPMISPVDGKVFLPVSRRISGPHGTFKGVAVAVVEYDYFVRQYTPLLTLGGDAFVLFHESDDVAPEDSMLMYITPEGTRNVLPAQSSNTTIAELIRACPLSTTSTALCRDYLSPINGTYRTAVLHRLTMYPRLVSIVSMENSKVFRQWLENVVPVLAAAALALAILGIGGWINFRLRRTEAVQAKELSQSRKQLYLTQISLDYAADMVLWITYEGKIIYANAAACERLGRTRSEIENTSLSQIRGSGAKINWQENFNKMRATGYSRYESEIRSKNNRVYPVEITATLVRSDDIEFSSTFVRDRSEHAQARKILVEQNIKLESSNAELAQFVYTISHDLREPLRMINSFTDLLVRRHAHKLDEEGQEFFGFVQDGGQWMDRMIQDLLEYSRVGRAGERRLSANSLLEPLQLALKTLRPIIMETNALIDLPTDSPKAMIHVEEMARLYQNLIGNSLKYRDPHRHPMIQIGIESVDNEVRCRVTDNGVGIDEKFKDRVFGIFQRLHCRGQYEGSGIGLAICKKIIGSHHGRIWIESKPGEGTTVWFTLSAPPQDLSVKEAAECN